MRRSGTVGTLYPATSTPALAQSGHGRRLPGRNFRFPAPDLDIFELTQARFDASHSAVLLLLRDARKGSGTR